MALLDNILGPSIRIMDKRKLIAWSSLACFCVLVFIIVIVLVTTNITGSTIKGRDVLSRTPLIDGHNDLPFNIRQKLKNNIEKFPFDKNLVNDTEWGAQYCPYCFTDLERLSEGKVSGQFWVAYADCNSQYKDAVAETFEQIDLIKRLINKYSHRMQLVTTAGGIVEAFQNGKLASIIAVEGGHSMDSRVGVLRMFYELGVRYMTLTHSCSTPWADASTFKDSKVNLTDYGKKIVLEMNRLGMMIDLSHAHRNVMLQTIETSVAPIIFSHSCAYEIHNHNRNVPDDVLHKLKENGGIVMISFHTEFLGDKNVANIGTVIRHINHIVDTIGFDHVGIGSDFDGMISPATGLEDVSKYPALFDELYSNNSEKWTIENLEKLAGKNILRVFQKVEKIKDDLKNQNPLEDWIPKEEMEIGKGLNECRTARDVAGPDEFLSPTDTPAIILTTEDSDTTYF